MYLLLNSDKECNIEIVRTFIFGVAPYLDDSIPFQHAISTYSESPNIQNATNTRKKKII